MLNRFRAPWPWLFALVLASPALAQSSRLPGAVEAALALRQVDGVKRVMLVAAHPDDEDTSLLALLARGMGAEAAYFSLTRGEGGQNLIGLELGEGLGVIRSGELLAARSVDGAGQFFSRAFDFGYSKTASETFGQWPRELLLSDLVWAIRTFRPHVLVSVFSGTPSDGHGQHQAAGLLARDAWEAAGDPSRFPEQLDLGVEPWTPLKMYRRTFFDPESATLALETGTLDPVFGRSYHQIAMDSRSRHGSQNFGTAQQPGPRQTHLAFIDSRVPSREDDPIFAGVDTTLATLAAPLGIDARTHVEAYRQAVSGARGALDVVAPARSLPHIAEAIGHLDPLIELAEARGTPEIRRELRRRRALLDEAALAVAAVRVELRSRSEILVPGQTAVLEARVWSGGDASVEAGAPRVDVPPGWAVTPMSPDEDAPPEDSGGFSRFFDRREEASHHDEAVPIEPGGLALWRYRVTVPADAETTAPYYLRNPRPGAFYDWTDDAATRTRPFQAPVLSGRAAIVIMGGGVEMPVSISSPFRYRGVDQASGEFWRPVQVAPRLSVRPVASHVIWPVSDSEPREVSLQLRSIDRGGVTGSIRLDVPPGWSVDPEQASFALERAGDETRLVFEVTPPASAVEGEFELSPIVTTPDGPLDAMDVTLIDYPHIEPRLMVASGAVRVVRFPIRVAERRVGYVMGSGDEGPQAIRQLGLGVEEIGPDDWTAEHLDRYDTIVLGVRAYEVRADLIAANRALLDWVSRGGTLLVQYNRLEFNDGDYAPYPIVIGRGRVTDENADVTLRLPDAAPFATPNTIRAADFDGWVQERGLYYPESWDDEYTELLGMRDPDEDVQTSSLLVAPYGDGLYVHTSLSFFRQLPAGVPGAFRLWANLLSIDARRWRGETAS
ncbi:MAG: PIG-L family deacetylase [Gemmatimonadota bacterium]|nr:PIG-L family deacetylase [Gemmatimonadota bacterium]